MVGDELRAVDEHPARPAGGVVDLAVEGLDHLDDQAHDRLRREELAAEPAFVGGELRQEVLVDEPERVSRDRPGERREEPNELEEDSLLELLVPARENAGEPCIDLLDRVHREVDVRAEVFAFGEVDEPRETRDLRHEEDAASPEVLHAHGAALGCLRRELRLQLVEAMLREREEDQAEHRPPIVGGRQARVRAQLVGGSPKAAFKVGQVGRGHARILIGPELALRRLCCAKAIRLAQRQGGWPTSAAGVGFSHRA